jgi:tRNA (guanine37-N1)-methyltransferase
MPVLKELLKGKLTKAEFALVPSSYDMLGDLAIFSDFPKELKNKEYLIAGQLLKLNKNIKVVLKKTKKYSGKFRTPKLKIIAGEKRKETELKENNARFRLNPEKAYFSVRLATERKRIADQVKKGEQILAMFSGIGVYPIVISKNKDPKEIVSIEINPIACKYQKENILLNKISNIRLYKGDVKKIVPLLKMKFDRILMPLPRGAEDYLKTALKSAKKGTIIHFYDFLHETEFKKAEEKIKKSCKKSRKKCKIIRTIRCGQFGPGIYRICVDFKLI